MKIVKMPPTFPFNDKYKKVDLGFWDKKGKYKRDIQFVNEKELKGDNENESRK